MHPRLRFFARLILLSTSAGGFITLGYINFHFRPHIAYLYFAIALFVILTFAAKFVLPLFLTPRQRTATKITSTIFSLALHFFITFLISLGLMAFGLTSLITHHDYYFVGIILILIGLLFAIYNFMRLVVLRNQTKTAIASTLRKHGFCTHCGYDLRESFTRCPECGNPVPPERQSKTRSISEGRASHTENVEI